MSKHLPLYSCSICGKPVKVIPQGEGIEPIYEYHKDCPHRDVTIYANRKVILRGKGKMSPLQFMEYKFKVKVSQLLSWITGKSM